MNRQEFLQLADQCLGRVEDWLEEFDPDEVDYSSADGVLTLELASGKRFVLNRQTAAHQMWFAAGARAWHYEWRAEAWCCSRDGHELMERIRTMVADELGRPIDPIP